jgi:hypothetical protein
MSQNNNDSAATGAIAFMIAGFIILAAIVFYALVFIAFVFSVICLFAWNKPRRIGGTVFMPEEARAFVGRGIAGALLLPAFCVFIELVFKVRINPEWMTHIIAGGYMLGSLGIQYLIEKEKEEAQARGETIVIPPQRLPEPPQTPAQPFRYASWNDEGGK